ncbi:sensor domain-containing protein [Metabacillus fastidiosus]|uniref:sensor domain-containing protein n=1 Tax=Metabacillus fastidiosus TaxID=1458 RepID=UPI003D2A8BC0
MRKIGEMFETYQLQSLLDNFQALLEREKDDHLKLEDYIKQISTALNDYTHLTYALDTAVIVAVTDTSGKIIYANDKFCGISKFSREELIGKTHKILNSGYHDPSFFKKMWKKIKEGKVWEGEIKNKAKDGTFYWVKTTIVPLKDADGIPNMFMALRTDITEGKLAQEKLVGALQNDFRTVVNSMHNLIFKVARNSQNEFVYVLNEGKLAYHLGLEKDKMKNKSPKDIYPVQLAKMLEEKYEKAFEGNNVTYDYSFNDKQLLTYLSPVYRDNIVVEIIGCVNDITELYDAQEKVKFMAFHDNITNLPNRRKFIEDVSGFITQSKLNNGKFAVFFLDLDRFKQINDSFGHKVGDNLIKEVSHRLKRVVEPAGRVYRLAGDEFIIVYPNIEDENIISQYAQIISAAFDTVFKLSYHLEIYTSTSIGVSIYPDHGKDYDTLLRNADIAMYAAKTNRNSVFSIYRPEMNKNQEEALLIEHHLRKAIEQNELELYYQPKLDLNTKQINGVEALLRWNNYLLGNVPPDKFIPIAEDTGLIIKLDEWVLETACQQNKEWNDAGFSNLIKMAVNISPLHFRLSHFEDVVKRILDKTGLEPSLLEIEITENSFIDNHEECIACLTKLKDIGISVAIDDFGKGYSSLNYLRKFPINSLKIDRTFIQEVSENNEDIAIVKAITHLARELNLKVVAEGIETKEVIRILEELGCDEIQGYYISKPLPKKRFEESYEQMNYCSDFQ